MKPMSFGLILLILTSACETSTDSIFGVGGGGGTVTQAQVAGDWSFTLTKTATLPCTGGALVDGQVIMHVLPGVIDSHVHMREPGLTHK
ncbi:MAG TPA: hypothetical protein VLJ83_10780, partial [Gemmatimonadaceae bacterium]|nr:hypothetical protein [Gemmatimonadaceae bacterium]